MPRVYVENYSQLRKSVGMEESRYFRDTVEVVDALQAYIDHHGMEKIATNTEVGISVAHQEYRDRLTGHFLFTLVGKRDGAIYFRFLTKVV